MLKQDPKTRCEKRSLSKCTDICRFYTRLQALYANILMENTEVQSFQCNVLLNDLGIGNYTSDFVCTKTDGSLMVRECAERKYLTKPMTIGLLEASRDYWTRRGITDWGIVTERSEVSDA